MTILTAQLQRAYKGCRTKKHTQEVLQWRHGVWDKQVQWDHWFNKCSSGPGAGPSNWCYGEFILYTFHLYSSHNKIYLHQIQKQMGTIYLNLHLSQCSDSLQARQLGFISWQKQGFPYLSPHPEWLRVPTVSYAMGTKDFFPTVKPSEFED